MDFNNTLEKLESLTVFRNLLSDEVIKRLVCFLENGGIGAYCGFVSSLFENTDNLSKYILTKTLNDDNFYIRNKSKGVKMGQCIEDAFKNDLDILKEISLIKSSDLKKAAGHSALPDYKTCEYDFERLYLEKIGNIASTGFGMFSIYPAFYIEDEKLMPIKRLDDTRLCDLKGYEQERKQVIENTKALLAGKPCSNVLLYGDSGTGKSSTVKGIINEFKDCGLRLIEVKKHQLRRLPKILSELGENPLKFIIFLDDLSFTSNDDDFGALKTILEGSVTSRGNIAVYVTSNRRHLVKESFSDRAGDDIHLQDTLEELTALSERFGLTLTFYKPDKKTYERILTDLWERYEIKMPLEEVLEKGEVYAINRSGKTARAAKQFIEMLKSSEN